MGVYSPITGSILEGSRGYLPYHQATDLTDTIRWPPLARRGLPFRPYLHARIPRITVAEQLPQINDNDETNDDIIVSSLYQNYGY